MKNEKFLAKQKELFEYEDIKYKSFLEFLAPYNVELNKRGWEVVCHLIFWYPKRKGENEQYPKSRQIFEKKENYICDLSLQFQKVGCDYFSQNIEDVGFQLVQNVTNYSLRFFTGRSFYKNYKMDNLLKEFKQEYDKVLKYGLESVSDEYKNMQERNNWKYSLTLHGVFYKSILRKIKQYRLLCYDRINLQNGIVDICKTLCKKYYVIQILSKDPLNDLMIAKSMLTIQHKKYTFFYTDYIEFLNEIDLTAIPIMNIFSANEILQDFISVKQQLKYSAFCLQLDDFLNLVKLRIDTRQYQKNTITKLTDKYSKKSK